MNMVVKVSDQGILNMRLYRRMLSDNYMPAVVAAMTKVADTYKENIQLAIVNRKVPGKPLAPGTLAKRKYGKSAGYWPAIPAYQGDRPWIRSGTLMGSIQRKKTGPFKWTVAPEEGVVLPFSGSGTISGIMTADRAATLLEYGFTVSIPETYRMRGYLARMYMKATGSGGKKRHKSNLSVKTGRVLTVRVPPRPLFHQVDAMMMSDYVPIAAKEFEARFWKGVR